MGNTEWNIKIFGSIIFFDLLLGIHHKETKQITADKKQRLKQDDNKKRKDLNSYLCITDCWPGIASL